MGWVHFKLVDSLSLVLSQYPARRANNRSEAACPELDSGTNDFD